MSRVAVLRSRPTQNREAALALNLEDPSYRPAQKTTRKTQNRHGKPNSLISMADLAAFCHCDSALLPNPARAGDIIPNSMINSYVRQLWREKRIISRISPIESRFSLVKS